MLEYKVFIFTKCAAHLVSAISILYFFENSNTFQAHAFHGLFFHTKSRLPIALFGFWWYTYFALPEVYLSH